MYMVWKNFKNVLFLYNYVYIFLEKCNLGWIYQVFLKLFLNIEKYTNIEFLNDHHTNVTKKGVLMKLHHRFQERGNV